MMMQQKLISKSLFTATLLASITLAGCSKPAEKSEAT